MKAVDLTGILNGRKKGWVALTQNYKKVVASASTLEKMDKKLENIGNPDVVLLSASNNYKGFITTA